MERIAGICFCKVDGDMLNLEGTISISPVEATREPVVSSTGVIGYNETPRSPTIEVTTYPNSKNQIKKLLGAIDMTVTAELANGLVFTLSEAFVSGEPTFDAQAGTASITFSGVRGDWA